jgi:hypothetical protein
VFENSVLKGNFGPKRDEATGEWRKLHNEELNDLYCSPNIVGVIKWRRISGGACSAYGEGKAVYRVLVWKLEEKRMFGRPSRRWEDNIKMDLQEVGCGGMDWIDLVQDRDRWRSLANEVMNHRVLLNVGNFLTTYKPVRFSRRTLLYGVSKELIVRTHTHTTNTPHNTPHTYHTNT